MRRETGNAAAANSRRCACAFAGPSDGAALRGEEGIALFVVVLVAVVLLMLGLGAAALGSLESASARHELAARQAARAAESGLAAVKHWFDAPAGTAGAWQLPSASQVDRSQRRVDPEGDGSFVPYASAASPWNVIYRQGRDDVFERPYRGTPALSFEGDVSGPDLVIDRASADPAVHAFLRDLSQELFPAGFGSGVSARISRIAVFGPPRLRIGTLVERLGIASIDVDADVVRGSAETGEVLASARASGVLQEIPYAAPGPVSAAEISGGSGWEARWGSVASAGDVDTGADPSSGMPWGWPWRSLTSRLVADADLDGTPDDVDGDGTPDASEWLASGGPLLADPWFRVIAGGVILGAPAGSQPWTFDSATIPGTYRTESDRSSLFQLVSGAVSYRPDPRVFRAAAADGGPAAHLFRYVPGTSPPLFREGGGAPVDFERATAGREGLFYFDTTDGAPPLDANGDGVPDNLTPAIVVADPDWWASGCVFVNATAFSIPHSSRAARAEIAPPGEPFADLDRDGTCDSAEPFLRLGYPADPLAPGAGFTKLDLLISSAVPGSPRLDRGPPITSPVSFAGLILSSGSWVGASDARIFGALACAGRLSVPAAPGAGPLQVLYDARLAHDAWPPAASRLPRTVWQRRSVAP